MDDYIIDSNPFLMSMPMPFNIVMTAEVDSQLRNRALERLPGWGVIQTLRGLSKGRYWNDSWHLVIVP